MVAKKHKRKINHVVIVTSDAVDAHVKQFRIKPWLLQVCIIGLCIIIGGMVGFVIYEDPFQSLSTQSVESDATIVEHLEEDKKSLEAEIISLNSKIEILSDTINKKVIEEMDLLEKLEKQNTPLLLPLAGSAKLEEISQEEPSCIFSGVEGTTIIATGTGTVKEIVEDETYGTKVTIEQIGRASGRERVEAMGAIWVVGGARRKER